MEWIQATSRPCYHHRFPIRLVRRPSPSGTPTSLEQTSQPRTTLMNWRCPSVDKTIRIWELSTGKSILFRGHYHGVNQVAWSPDGILLASCSFDRTIRIWDSV